MVDDRKANGEGVADDHVGKLFIRVFTNGDLPMNPMMLGECVVCGGVFTRDETQKHAEIPCEPTTSKSLAAITGRK